MNWLKNRNMDSFIKFLIVGSLTTGLNLIIFYYLNTIKELTYPISISLAYVISVFFHFLANRNITFQDTQANFSHQIFRYICLIVINYGLSLFIVHVSVQYGSCSPLMGLCISIGIITLFTYGMTRYWVFASTN